ncbi:MAG: hypothetical protein QFE16_11550 [Pseudomonadota bacterium]|nr:hypothetical protein [Pseudomonadota bacterium]
MSVHPIPSAAVTETRADEFGSADAAVSVLLGRIYEIAPPTVRTRLLTQLMQPLGLLSLVAVAGGVFARLRLRNASAPLNLQFEDTLQISAADVMALADHAQQVSVETVDALAQWLTTGPVLASSAAALLLVQVLAKRAARRNAARNSVR